MFANLYNDLAKCVHRTEMKMPWRNEERNVIAQTDVHCSKCVLKMCDSHLTILQNMSHRNFFL